MLNNVLQIEARKYINVIDAQAQVGIHDVYNWRRFSVLLRECGMIADAGIALEFSQRAGIEYRTLYRRLCCLGQFFNVADGSMALFRVKRTRYADSNEMLQWAHMSMPPGGDLPNANGFDKTSERTQQEIAFENRRWGISAPKD